jgi:hypothetical protein
MAFRFQNFTAKLGNMKKAQEFTVCPVSNTEPHLVTVQSDKRIARIDLTTGKAMLSDGKGGHPGFHKLLPMCGAVEVDVAPDVLDEVRRLSDNVKAQQAPDGSVQLTGA